MSETGNGPNDDVEDALTDHHLDEVAEMIESMQAQKPSSESPCSDGPCGCLRGS